jgi:hypothetical protein
MGKRQASAQNEHTSFSRVSSGEIAQASGPNPMAQGQCCPTYHSGCGIFELTIQQERNIRKQQFMKARSMATACVVAILISSASASGAEQYVLSLVADAMSLSPATNALGSFTFLNLGDGYAYNYKLRRVDGSITEDIIAMRAGLAFLDWVDIQKSVDREYDIGVGRAGSTGTIRITRLQGDSIGSYAISGQSVGTIIGKFGMVRLSGIVQQSAGGWSGVLRWHDNPFGSPEILGLNSGAAFNDFIGFQAGMNYGVSLSGNNTAYVVDNTFGDFRPWKWFRGAYAKIPDLGTLGFTLTIESSSGASQPWSPLLTIPLQSSGTQSLYRLIIRR